jgi:integrase
MDELAPSSSTLAPPPGADLVLAKLDQLAKELEAESRAGSSWQVYATNWRLFEEWCRKHEQVAMPVETETIRRYVASMESTHKVATIRKKLSSISVAHEVAGIDGAREKIWAPSVTGIIKGIASRHAKIPEKRVRKKKALRTSDLSKIVSPIGRTNPLDVRDRAILLLIMPGAFRRSELAALNLTDLEEVDEGLVATVHTSKTDREGRGLIKGIPFGSNPSTCPVRAWRAWVKAYGVTEGPAFPSMDRWGHIKYDPQGATMRMRGRDVADVIMRRARKAGLVGNWGGHSGRRGFATEAVHGDASERSAKRQGGWKSGRVFEGYIDEAEIWKDNAAMKLGL